MSSKNLKYTTLDMHGLFRMLECLIFILIHMIYLDILFAESEMREC